MGRGQAGEQTEILGQVRDLLMMILACQCCPYCQGTGSTKQAPSVAEGFASFFGKRDPGVSRPGERCACRDNGVRLIEEFTGEEILPRERAG